MTASWATEGDSPYVSVLCLSFVIAQLTVVLHCMLQQRIWGTVMAHCAQVLAIAACTHAIAACTHASTVGKQGDTDATETGCQTCV
jgi:hypothetical protein